MSSAHPVSMQSTDTQTQLRTLVVSAPGVMGDSLRALFASFPQIEIIGSAAGCLTAHHLIKKLVPDLVVIDANHPESEVVSLLQSFETAANAPFTIIFTNTPRQKARIQKAGADTVLFRNTSQQPLTEAFARLHALKYTTV